MAGDDTNNDDRGTYTSSWSLLLPGGARFHIGLIPSMAVENAYREWADTVTAQPSTAQPAPSAGPSAESLHSFFLPLTPQQATQLRHWVLDEDASSKAQDGADDADTTDKKLTAAVAAAELLLASTSTSASGSVPLVLSKLMVDYSTGTCQLLLPAELLRGLDATDSARAPTVEMLTTSHNFAFLGDGTPLALQRDGTAVGPLYLPVRDTAPSATSAATPTTTTTATTSSKRMWYQAPATSTRGKASRQKVVWSWEGAGRLQAYSNAISKRIEEGYINYLCFKREQDQKNAAMATGDGQTPTTATTTTPPNVPPAQNVSNVTVRGQSYAMDYVDMVQRNPRTGRTRPLKREGPAPLLPVSVQDTTSTDKTVAAATTDVAGSPAVSAATVPAIPPGATPQQIVRTMLPGKWQFMRVRGRKWFNFDDADNKSVEEAYQNFIMEFRASKRPADLDQTLAKTLGKKAAEARAAAAPQSEAATTTTTATTAHVVPARTVLRANSITTAHQFTNTDKCRVVMNDHKEPFEAFLQQTNSERATLIRLLYSTESTQFVLATAVWEILGDDTTSDTLPGKGCGRLEETLTLLGTDGTSAADAFTEQLTEVMCEVAALRGGGIDNSQTARRLLPNRGVVAGVACGTENFTYTFDLVRMMQTNEQTRQSRRIRRLTSGMPGFDGHYTVTPPLGTAARPTDATDVPTTTVAAATATTTGASTTTTTTTAKARTGKSVAAPAAAAVKLPLDKHIPGGDNMEPVEVDGDFYYCMLNQANVTSNANKFYCIQLVKDKRTNRYSVYTRFGRVGDVGTPGFVSTDSSLDWAVRKFEEQFRKKAHCTWADRETAKPKTGQYAYMKLDLTATAPTDSDKDGTGAAAMPLKDFNPMVPANAPPSKLHPLVKDLMEYISDRSDMNNMMERDFSLDVKRMPLGNITKEQIKDALSVLAQIDNVLRDPLELQAGKKLAELSNAFYTLVPHRVSKMERLPVIGDVRALHKKVQLMQTLGDLEIAAELLKKVEDTRNTMVEHPLDTVYRQLQCQLTPLPDTDPMVVRIRHYVEETRGKTHYNVPEVEQVFCVDRADEDARFEGFLDAHKGEPGAPDTNRVMLWHGSRKTNFLGILSKGLRIAPPEAPSTGYMFGKGIYFSDVVTKASNYCFSNNKTGLILLNEVALGKTYELGKSEFMLKPHAGTFSTHGVGGSAPDPSGYETHNNVLWPMGKTREIKHPRIKKTSLLYPEFIIYNEAQYRMRYLLRLRFK